MDRRVPSFTLSLYSVTFQKLNRASVLYDEQGKPMEALKVFAAAIGYLKRHVMGVCGQKFGGVRENDIHWVLTIPAIWGDVAKKFMREAAEQVLFNAMEFILHEQNTEILRRLSTVETVLSDHSKIDKIKVLKTNDSLMKVESIAECSLGAFCNTFYLH